MPNWGVKIRIKSQFTDYYDHVGHMYGGGDPSIPYIRNRLVELQQRAGTLFPGTLDVKIAGVRRLPFFREGYGVALKWLAVCGKYYLLVGRTLAGDYMPTWRILAEKEHPLLWKNLGVRRLFGNRDHPHNYIGNNSSILIELSRRINAPVFTLRSNDSQTAVVVDGEIPILKDVGMPSLINAQTLYQDISYFMGNIIKESPDMAPPSKMTDKEKISQHGFDNRISFRHRL